MQMVSFVYSHRFDMPSVLVWAIMREPHSRQDPPKVEHLLTGDDIFG